MKKFTPILILILMIGVVSVSGCITILDAENNTTTDSTGNSQIQDTAKQNTTAISVANNVNNSGNIIITTKEKSKDKKDKLKNQNTGKTNKDTPKISKEEIEKEVVRILKLDNPEVNFTAEATLVYDDKSKAYYIVDVYDDKGWFGYFEIDANEGPKGNDAQGYSFDGGAVRDETSGNVESKISTDEAEKKISEELKSKYSIENAEYSTISFVENNTEYYNITIKQTNTDNQSTTPIGFAIMNANSGEIINITLEKDVKESDDKNTSNQKIYSVDEAGDYVDITYKGEKVSVRENYPYYSPQNEKIYYSQEEEAEDLYQMAIAMK